MVAGFAFVLASSVALARWSSSAWPWAWSLVLGPPLVTWTFVAVMLWRARGEADVDADVDARLGLATGLTLARGALVSLVSGFLFMRATGVVAWLPGALYALAAATDNADGRVARRLGQVTRFGARLDVAMDGLGLLVAPLVAVAWQRLPPWYLLVGAAYYLFHGGLWIHRRVGWPVYPLRPSRVTRFFAGVQMVVVAAALLPFWPAAFARAIASVLMLPTLVLFARDWLVVSGRLGAGVPPAETPRR